MNAPKSDQPLIESPATAAEALRDYFLANAEAGNDAANDELVAELVRRIRTQQASGEGGRKIIQTERHHSAGYLQ